jgi:hypothetical protein
MKFCTGDKTNNIESFVGYREQEEADTETFRCEDCLHLWKLG